MANLENNRQVSFIKEKLEYVARGEGDLTANIHLLHFDEIGELCVTINRLIGFLAGLIENVKPRQIEETAGVLKKQAGENQKAVLELTDLMGGLSEALGMVMESAHDISDISSKTQLLPSMPPLNRPMPANWGRDSPWSRTR